MIEGGLARAGIGPSGEILVGIPGIEMSVEVENRDGVTVNSVESSKGCEGDAVIAT